ncbi:hypothetical protein [Chryseobacterium sp. WX]|uniref:hypothetical protein n=1 Tax=Chryseobacterium sp. WX TaxID=3031803 RepID=UPI00240A4D04|nr:hypothetical protein [Chryseobacterium sp. WX]WFB67044.1 hypothetical protein PZ898_20370 [Chryseobacterium sp. WX]
MKNSKYIKVSVSERLPRKVRTDVIVLWTNEEETISAGSGFFTEKGYWWVYDSGCSVPEYWLEEKPDYEDEMKEMLEKNIKQSKENINICIEKNMLNNAHSWEGRLMAYKECLELLTKLKKES